MAEVQSSGIAYFELRFSGYRVHNLDSSAVSSHNNIKTRCPGWGCTPARRKSWTTSGQVRPPQW
eukprot:6176955-Pleurochrysis_carterae.AAC.1